MKLENILIDIPSKNTPIGEPDEESMLFFDIDKAVMKIGSLQHDTINWETLILNCIKYLYTVCKDYKVLQYLCRALLQSNATQNVLDFLLVFEAFNNKYLSCAYPKPSTQGQPLNRFKLKSIALIVQRLSLAFDNDIESVSITDNAEKLSQLLTSISLQLKGFDAQSHKTLEKLANRIESITPNSKPDAVIQPDNISKDIEEIPSAIAVIEAPQVEPLAKLESIPNVSLFDLSNERELKTLYIQVADITSEIAPASALGYISRRYGLWRSITQLPDMDQYDKTMMPSIPKDKMMDYREAVKQNPSHELLNKIEKSVVSSPYWIEGSYLSAQCCLALDYEDAAEAILSTTRDFVSKFSHFKKALFQTGEPFIPEHVMQWLEAKKEPLSKVDMKRFDDIYQSNGFIPVLKAIDEAMAQALDVRETSHLYLDKIHYLIAEGMNNMALHEIDELLKNSKKYAVECWDARFFAQLEQLKTQLTKGN